MVGTSNQSFPEMAIDFFGVDQNLAVFLEVSENRHGGTPKISSFLEAKNWKSHIDPFINLWKP